MRQTSGQWRRVADGPLARPNGISEESGIEASLEALRPMTSLRALRGGDAWARFGRRPAVYL